MYNVSNKLARNSTNVTALPKSKKPSNCNRIPENLGVMTTKYCIKYELKNAQNTHPNMDGRLKEPLVLKQGELEYKLKFNCKPCEMEIWEKDAEFEIEEATFINF